MRGCFTSVESTELKGKPSFFFSSSSLNSPLNSSYLINISVYNVYFMITVGKEIMKSSFATEMTEVKSLLTLVSRDKTKSHFCDFKSNVEFSS